MAIQITFYRSSLSALFILVLFLVAPAAHASTLSNPTNNLGLVGYWPLDSVSGTAVADLSGSGNTGTTVNSPTTTTGKVGRALLLSGTQYVDVPMTINYAGLTVSAWIKPTSVTGSNPRVVANSHSDQDHKGFQLRFNNGGTTGMFDINGCVAYWASTLVPGNWYLFTGTYDGSNIHVYMSGVLVGSGTCSGSVIASGYDVNIGRNPVYGGDYFSGVVDDVRIYNRGLSAADVAALYAHTLSVSRQSASPTKLVTNGLVGYWTFDGANTNWSANTTADSSGNGNTGTLISMSTTTSPVMGRFGQALSFNGSNYIATSYQQTNVSSYSESVWVKTTGNQGVFVQDRGTGGGQSLTLGMGPTGAGGAFPAGNGRPYFALDLSSIIIGVYANSVSVNDGNWHLVTGIFNGSGSVVSSNFSLYVDGNLVTVSAVNIGSATVPLTGQGGTYIGYHQSWNIYFTGFLDDVRLYNRVLSASEIQQLYNAGAPGKGATIGEAPTILALQSGLVGYWPFDGKSMNWTTNKALDMSGSGNNGTLISMSTTTSPVIGKIGQALSFNGTNQYVISNNLPVGGPLDISSAWSASAWITLPSSPVNNTTYNVVGYTSAGYQQYGVYFFYYNNQWYFRAGDTHGQAQYTVGTVAPGTWLHVTATYDGATIRNYMNGKLVAQGGSTSTYTSSGPKYLQIGTWNGSQFWEGAIDDVRVYNRALSAAEVKQLYNLGR